MTRYICVECRVEMRCEKNEVGADYGNGCVFASDRYKCPECGTKILVTAPASYYNPDYIGMPGGWLRMKEGE